MQELNLIGIISTGGSLPPVIEPKTITENGTYNVPSGVDGFNPVVVNVPTPQPVIESKTITENGTYNAPSGVDGFSPVVVNVPTPQPVIESKTITENGTYNVPSGVDGFNPVVVNVPPTPTPTPAIRSNNDELNLGIAEVEGNDELVLTFKGFSVRSVESLNIVTNPRLCEGLDTNTLKLCKVYDSRSQTVQIGWIGFYQNTIRAWNVALTENILLNYAWGSLILSDSTSQQDNPFIDI